MVDLSLLVKVGFCIYLKSFAPFTLICGRLVFELWVNYSLRLLAWPSPLAVTVCSPTNMNIISISRSSESPPHPGSKLNWSGKWPLQHFLPTPVPKVACWLRAMGVVYWRGHFSLSKIFDARLLELILNSYTSIVVWKPLNSKFAMTLQLKCQSYRRVGIQVACQNHSNSRILQISQWFIDSRRMVSAHPL